MTSFGQYSHLLAQPRLSHQDQENLMRERILKINVPWATLKSIVDLSEEELNLIEEYDNKLSDKTSLAEKVKSRNFSFCLKSHFIKHFHYFEFLWHFFSFLFVCFFHWFKNLQQFTFTPILKDYILLNSSLFLSFNRSSLGHISLQYGEALAKIFLAMLAKIQKNEHTQYVITLMDEFLKGVIVEFKKPQRSSFSFFI
jgi:hypothetical protein